MRKITWVLAIVMSVSMLLMACGSGKNAEDVVQELDRKLKAMESYKAVGTMKLHGGDQPQEYDVSVWYKKPDYYRIELANKNKDVTQIVLRNDDGVFVLTPHLKKSFRFQSDWPNNQGQVYLYQTVIQGIIKDTQRQFTQDKDKGAYVFEVAGNYQNHSFARQKIWLTKNNYEPTQIQIFNQQNELMVAVEFSDFQFGNKFEKDDFDMNRNLTAFNMLSVATTGQATADSDSLEQLDQSFGVIEPAYIPEGVLMMGYAEMNVGEGKGMLIRYSGAYNYVLVESRPQAQTVSSPTGEIIDLGFTLGVLTGKEQKSLAWTVDGIEYRLTSADLPVAEMMRIAESTEGQSGK